MNHTNGIIIFTLFLLLIAPASTVPAKATDFDLFDWTVVSTVHFDVLCPAGLEDLGVRAARLSEQSCLRASSYLGHTMARPQQVIVLPSNNTAWQAFADNRPGPEVSGRRESPDQAITVCFSGSYHDLGRKLTRAIALGHMREIFAETGAGGLARSGLRLPFWAQEGLAEYIASGFNAPAGMAVREMMARGEHVGLPEKNAMYQDDAGLQRRKGQAFCYFLEKRYGIHVFGELIRELRDTADFGRAIHACTGVTAEDLEREMEHFFSQMYGRFLRGAGNTGHETMKYGPYPYPPIPAVSPDGTMIAVLTADERYTDISIVMREPGTRHISGERRRRLRRERFDRFEPPESGISWSRDGCAIVTAGFSGGRTSFMCIDPRSGRATREILFPFSAVMHPSLSGDGGSIAFSAVAGSAADIYLYDMASGKITRLTDDIFSDIQPVFSGDGNRVIFVSNRNDANDPAGSAYDICEIDIRNGRRSTLVANGARNIQPDLSADGTRLLFVSDAGGASNAYVYDFISKKTTRVTDSLTGVFHPRWLPEGDAFACSEYGPGGYAVSVRTEKEHREPRAFPGRDDGPAGTAALPDGSGYAATDYRAHIRSASFQAGAAAAMSGGLVGSLSLDLADTLGRFGIRADFNYVRAAGGHDANVRLGCNFQAARWTLGLCAFRQGNPLTVTSAAGRDEWPDEANFGMTGMEHYGGYVTAGRGIARHVRFDLKGTFERYDKRYPDTDCREDIHATLGRLSFSLIYDSVLRGAMVPMEGFSGILRVEQAFDIAGKNHALTMASLDLRQYVMPCDYIVLAFREAAATVAGRNSGGFRYHAGGFNTLRGFALNEFSGRNLFLATAELRFTFVEAAKFGLLSGGGAGQIGGVIFLDAGSAWDGGFSFVDSRTGRFDDIKMDFGVGIRAALFPILILKLDFACPFDKKSLKDCDMLFSMGLQF